MYFLLTGITRYIFFYRYALYKTAVKYKYNIIDIIFPSTIVIDGI